MSPNEESVAASWDAEYRAGRYALEPPVAFVDDILRCVAAAGLPPGQGLYIGCGNGRNYLPLLAGGLDLIGLDISRAALDQLAERAPHRASALVLGDLSSFPPEAAFPIVVGIQVFQHGLAAEAREHLAHAVRLVLPGGLFCLRVNAVGTNVHNAHRSIERASDGSFTVRYESGPKAGLAVHFFAKEELNRLLGPLEPVLPLRTHATERIAPATGRWIQWEGIWRRRSNDASRP